LLEETREIARRRGFRLHVLEGKRGTGTSWLNVDDHGRSDLERLLQMAPKVKDSDIYVCGPVAWTHAVERSLKAAGTPDYQVHAEEFAW
jgi:ferredoxin-NADP reductase